MTSGGIEETSSRSAGLRNLMLGVVGVGVGCAALATAVIFRAGPGDSVPEPLQDPQSAGYDLPDYGWPTTIRNPPGIYSLDESRCGTSKGSYCSVRTIPRGYGGFIHNGYGSGDIDILVRITSSTARLDDAVHADPGVAVGQDGIYRRTDARREEWRVDAGGTTIVVELKAKPGTSRADLAEAHAVVESMHTEPDTNYLGYKLVFMLTSNDWDSG